MTVPKADDASDRRADAFAALSDPLRVEILQGLSAHTRTTGDPIIGFAELRKRVDGRDSGRFRYHLNELRDNFVEKADGGYRLTHAGIQMVGAILAGSILTRYRWDRPSSTVTVPPARNPRSRPARTGAVPPTTSG